ncbi:hypothetical protein J2732_005530 [Achromobacter deleyi]|uniref:class I SAM-dependent methyltransferase n=1 Tax=Achromobacter deleyi TaxID=1353891 RepID=UPI0028646A0B|nr:class I SAM-dependent methyltransferase [Achromobacter deleyi]MDR6604495.1 hypothetical protein [Achromobacter deleyi]
MTTDSLRHLYDVHTGKVSDKWEIYLEEYGRILDPYREKSVRLLEIGIQNGGSLEIWPKYFPNASKLVGCDINPDCAALRYVDPNTRVIVGDANAIETYATIINESATFDIIIDDGSHSSGDIIKSFCLYFPVLAQGGTFIAEDLHCSYWKDFEGGLFDPYSSISFFKLLIDILNFEHWGVDTPDRLGLLNGILSHHGCTIQPGSLSEIRSIEFINSICVIRKQPEASNALGQRIVAGDEELVIQGHGSLHQTRYSRQDVPPQANNPWSTRSAPPAESVLRTEQSLHAAEVALLDRDKKIRENTKEIGRMSKLAQDLQDALHMQQGRADAAEEVNAALLRSKSWRLTTPLRQIAALCRRIFK